MAVTISTPQFSFFQFNQPESQSCANNPSKCLPVMGVDTDPYNDILFQFFINATGDDEAALLQGISAPREVGSGNIHFYLIPSDATDGCAVDSIAPDYLANYRDWDCQLIPVTTIPGQTFISHNENVNADIPFDALASGACFTIIAIYVLYTVDGPVYTSLGCSNSFVKINDPCYTTYFYYNNNEQNAFGWYFSLDSSQEGVRLPLYLHSPEPVEESEEYEKSDGSTVLLSARIWKEYKFKANYVCDAWVEALTFVTKIKGLQLSNPYSDLNFVEVIRMEKIETDWVEETMPFFALTQVAGKFRLAAPRANVNSNCT